MKKIIFGIIFLVLGVYLLSLTYIGFHVFDDTTQKADAIVVLGAQSQYKDKINPCLIARVEKSVELEKGGLSPTIIMSGGVDRYGEKSEAAIMKDLAVKQGVDPADIFLEDKSKNTYENLVFTKKILAAHNLSNIIIVSDPYHLPRASLIAKTIGLSYTVAPAFASPCWSKYKFFGIDFFRDGAALLGYIATGKISLL